LAGCAVPWRGQKLAFRADEPIEIPEGAIKINLPDVVQETDYSCGAAALETICRYFRVGPGGEAQEAWYRHMLHTDPGSGTHPQALANLAKHLGLWVEEYHPCSGVQLRQLLDVQVPVILCLQAWGNSQEYPQDHSGHYVVACGYDDDHVYFEDPWLERHRGFLPWGLLDARWHDEDKDGVRYTRWALAIDKMTQPSDVATYSKDEKWEEDKHPRGKDGRFGSGSTKSKTKKKNKKEEDKEEDETQEELPEWDGKIDSKKVEEIRGRGDYVQSWDFYDDEGNLFEQEIRIREGTYDPFPDHPDSVPIDVYRWVSMQSGDGYESDKGE
jgi:predicted double-glycine peptidase